MGRPRRCCLFEPAAGSASRLGIRTPTPITGLRQHAIDGNRIRLMACYGFLEGLELGHKTRRKCWRQVRVEKWLHRSELMLQATVVFEVSGGEVVFFKIQDPLRTEHSELVL